MFRRIAILAVVASLAIFSATNAASAQVGQPVGTFNITVVQGGNTIVNHNVSIGAGGDLTDLSPWWVDGTPESFTQVGSISLPGGGATPIILKVTSDGGALESMRVLHFYVDVPASLQDIYTPGPASLFDPNGGDIQVTVSGFQFSNGADATPMVLDNDTYLTSFMLDSQGHFYESAQTNPYNYGGHGIYDIQVPGERYLDSSTGTYNFTSTSGTSSSWTWGSIVNPGPTTTVNNGTTGGLTPLIPGYVFELGMSAAFAAVPEPMTLAMMLPVLFLLRRSR